MGFWIQLAWAVFFTVVSELLRPKQRPDVPQPSSLDEFDLPTADDSRAVQAVFGRCKVDGPNVTWYGDLGVEPIKKKVKTGMFSSERITIGYKYFLGVELFTGHGPVDNLVEIRFGDLVPAGTRTETADTVTFAYDDPDLFGGKEQDGGITGTVRFYKGTQAQIPNAYLEAVRAKSLPAYRGFSYCALEHTYLGTRPNIKPISFIIERYPNQLGLTGGKHKIGTDANPACMIYELLTERIWACGVPSGLINVAGLQAIGNTLHAEGLGISMLLNGTTTARNLIDEILRHVDGVMYSDPVTGLIDFALARADYVVADLPLYGPSEISEVTPSRISWDETKNTIKAQYLDQAQNYTERSVQAQDLANITARNGTIDAESIQFLGFTNSTNAAFAASRALKTLSYPLAKISVKMNRKGWKLRPGSVFRLTWPPYNIEDVVVRVIAADYGDSMSSQLAFDVVEDIFAVASNIYTVPAPSGWVNPSGPPIAVAAQYAFEAPYQVVMQEQRYAIIAAARSGGTDLGFNVYHDPAGGASYVESTTENGFTPTATLKNAYAASTAAVDATGFIVQGTIDVRQLENADTASWLAGGSLLLVKSAAGEELMAWQTVADLGGGEYQIGNVIRGVYDTVPLAHDAGSRVWFVTDGLALTSEEPYSANGTVTGKVLPYNPRGVLPIASAAQFSVALAERAKKPYPAGNVRVNGALFPTSVVGDATLTWAHRHRVSQATAGVVVAQDAGDYVASPEGNYTVYVYVNGVLKRTAAALSGGPYVYTAAMRLADDANPTNPVHFRLRSVNGAYTNERRTTDFVMS